MNPPKWIEKPTTKHSPRKYMPNLIVLHHTAGDLAGDLHTLVDAPKKVSADYLVAQDGTIFKINPQLTQYYTWHAGKSEWKGKKDLNRFSIGIEMEHKMGEAWTQAQIDATAKLCGWLQARFGIKEIVGHRDISPGRKIDPENFPWTQFRKSLNLSGY